MIPDIAKNCLNSLLGPKTDFVNIPPASCATNNVFVDRKTTNILCVYWGGP